MIGLSQPAVAPHQGAAAPDATAQAGAAVRRHGFVLGSLGLLLPSDVACEVDEEMPACALPNAPDWLAGMASQRGNIVAVFDLQVYLGLTAPVPAPVSVLRAVVIGQRESAVGVRLHDLPARVALAETLRAPYPPGLPPRLRRHAKDCFRAGAQLWIDWDVDGFFADVARDFRAGRGRGDGS